MSLIALSEEYYSKDIINERAYKERRLDDLSRSMTVLNEQIQHTGKIIGRYRLVSPAFFNDAEFLAADEKRRVLHDWEKFIKNGYAESCFTNRLYNHLYLHCGYIAHYNRAGYYHTYWRNSMLEYAKSNDLAIRPVPATFYNYTSFLVQFNIWGDFTDINTSLMYSLRTQLIRLRKELENEVVLLFQKDVTFKSQLASERKIHIDKKIENLSNEIKQLQSERNGLTPETFIDQQAKKYKTLFPSIDENFFTMKGSVGNLL